MKKNLLLLVFAAILSLQACADKKQVITFDQLPDAAKVFVSTYFDQQAVSYVMMESEMLSKDYEVQLQNGTEIAFNQDGELDKVETKPYPMPDGIVPEKIKEYIVSHFHQAQVVKYDVDTNKQSVELDNDIELEFDMKGNFLRLDD